MHKEILSDQQLSLLPLLHQFVDDFILIGGTAIALHLGHRKSIDFDLASNSPLKFEAVLGKIRSKSTINSTLVSTPSELTVVVNIVKVTFLHYPFSIKQSHNLNNIINYPDLETLSAMKAYTLGRRAKWKDYVDLFFILKELSFSQVVKKANLIFGNEFNEKLLREQMCYFEDIDYTETIDYMPGHEISDDKIQTTLRELSLQR